MKRRPIDAMTAALDVGTADHVVIGMRYLRGGDGPQLDPIINALKVDSLERPVSVCDGCSPSMDDPSVAEKLSIHLSIYGALTARC